jgi:hypothetical protein
MRNSTLMGPWIRRFLLEHLVAERNLARNTQCSYRDTMVLLLPFMSRTLKTPVDQLAVSDLSPRPFAGFSNILRRTAVAAAARAICASAPSTRWRSSSAPIVQSMWPGVLRSGQFPLGRPPSPR